MSSFAVYLLLIFYLCSARVIVCALIVPNEDTSLCNEKVCIKDVGRIVSWMNSSAEICDDFEGHVCGQFTRYVNKLHFKTLNKLLSNIYLRHQTMNDINRLILKELLRMDFLIK